MINSTAINKVVLGKVLDACTIALTNESGASYIDNRKGNPFLRVKRIVKRNGKLGFEVLDKSNKNVAKHIVAGIVSQRGFKLMGKHVYHLNEFLLNRIAYDFEIGLNVQ